MVDKIMIDAVKELHFKVVCACVLYSAHYTFKMIKEAEIFLNIRRLINQMGLSYFDENKKFTSENFKTNSDFLQTLYMNLFG